MKILASLRSAKTWLTIIALLMVFYQLFYTQYFLWEANIHRIVHLGFAFIIILLSAISKRNRFFILFLILVSAYVTVHMVILYPNLGVTTSGVAVVLPPTSAMIIGAIALSRKRNLVCRVTPR